MDRKVGDNGDGWEMDDLQADKSLHSFGYAHYFLPVYRHPSWTVFIHIILLGIFNIAFFFPAIRSSIGSLSLLAIGYITIIISVRTEFPRTS